LHNFIAVRQSPEDTHSPSHLWTWGGGDLPLEEAVSGKLEKILRRLVDVASAASW
jgi:hypothetical protein